MTIVITRENALRELRQIVQKQGEDYIYQQHASDGVSCRYVWQGKPDCIIGRLLYALGVSIGTLKDCDEIGSIDELVDKDMGIEVPDHQLLMALRELQGDQDGGLTWGRAFKRFENTLNRTLV